MYQILWAMPRDPLLSLTLQLMTPQFSWGVSNIIVSNEIFLLIYLVILCSLQFDSGLRSMENIPGFYHGGNFYGNHNQGVYMHYTVNYQPNARIWNGNQRFKARQNFRREGEFEELTRGPRANTKVNASKVSGEQERKEQMIQRDKYNLEGFQSEYESAKFYVIKSYSEDDVHKCVKYDVWSSTPNGNRKLDDAFHDAETKAIETGSKYPVFLFFSVSFHILLFVYCGIYIFFMMLNSFLCFN